MPEETEKIMENTKRKRIEVWFTAEGYNQLLKLNSLRVATEKRNIPVSQTVRDIIEEKFKLVIG